MGQRHPLKNAKAPELKIIFQNFGCALQFEQKIQMQRRFGGGIPQILQFVPEISRSCPGDVPDMSRRCPGVPELSRRCPGDVPDMSRRFPGDVPDMSRRCPGDVPEDSRMSPTCGLLQIPKIRVFLFFPRFWSNFLF